MSADDFSPATAAGEGAQVGEGTGSRVNDAGTNPGGGPGAGPAPGVHDVPGMSTLNVGICPGGRCYHLLPHGQVGERYAVITEYAAQTVCNARPCRFCFTPDGQPKSEALAHPGRVAQPGDPGVTAMGLGSINDLIDPEERDAMNRDLAEMARRRQAASDAANWPMS